MIGQKNAMRFALLSSVSATALIAGYPMKQAKAQAELSNSTITVANQTAGVKETTAGATAVTVDTNGGAITFGANNVAAITVNGTTANLTLTVDASGNANAVNFLGDIVTTASGDTLTINHIDNAIKIAGNITEAGGASPSGAIVINSGSTGQDVTTTITFDNAENENLTIAAAIDGVDAGDTVNIVISSTNTGGNTITFTDTIGSNVDSITIGVDETAANRVFQANVSATAITIGGTANVINNVTFQTATDGTSITIASTIAVINATGTDKILVLDSGSTTADTVTFTGAIGGAGAVIDSIDIGSATLGGHAIFTGAIGGSAVPAAITIVSGNVSAETSSATFTNAAVIATAFTLTETIAAAGQATLKFNGTTQAIAGTINGNGSGRGTMIVDSTAATFAGVVGAIQPLREIKIGSTDGTNSSANFGAAASTVAFTLGNGGSTVDTATLILDANSATFAVAGTIDGNATDTATLTVTDATDGAAADLITITGNVGAGVPLDQINIGTSSEAGQAKFSGTVAATALTITTGGSAGETAAAQIVGAANITTITLTGGAINANQDATLEFEASLTGTSITLDEDIGQATLKFDTSANDVSNTVASTVDGSGTGNEGAILITDSETTGTDETVTFSANIGATKSLRAIAIGSGTGGGGGGNAIFSGSVTASTIIANATDTNNAGVSTGIFNGAVVGNLSLIGGNNDAEDATLDFNGDLNATTIVLEEADAATGDATVIFSGTTTQTITVGTINATGAGEGDVTISGSDVRMSGTIGQTTKVGTVLISGTARYASTTSIDATAVNLTGTLHIGDTIKIGDAAVTQADLGNGSNAKIVMDSPVATYDGGVIIDAADTASTLDASNVVDVTPHASFTSGSIIIVNGGSQTTNALTNGDFNVAATTLATYAVTTSSNVNTITATPKSAAATAAEIGISTQQAAAVGQAAVATAGDAVVTLALNSALAAGGVEAQKAAKQVINDAGALSATGGASAGAGAASFSAVGTRLASLRERSHQVAYASGDASLGFAAGSGPLADTVWLKPFAGYSDQDLRNDIDGFRTDTKGVAAGWDTDVGDGTKLGVYGSFSITDVDGRGVSDPQSSITTQLIGAYGDYTTNSYYLEGMVAVGRNTVDTDRLLDFGGLNVRAKGSFNSTQYQAKVGAGAPITAGGMFITPNASLSYTHVAGQSFVETNAGVLNLSVNQDDTKVILGQAGLKVHANIKDDGGVWIPEFRANIMNDFAGDEASSTSQFANGLGTAFNVTGAEVAQLSGSLGVGMMYEVDNMKVGVSYDYVQKADYHGHNGTISARWNF